MKAILLFWRKIFTWVSVWMAYSYIKKGRPLSLPKSTCILPKSTFLAVNIVFQRLGCGLDLIEFRRSGMEMLFWFTSDKCINWSVANSTSVRGWTVGRLLFLRDFVQLLASCNCSIADNATDLYTKDLLVKLNTMKKLDSHPNVVQLLGCVTKSGKQISWCNVVLTDNIVVRPNV